MNNSNENDAQVIIEFTFAFVILLLILYGCIMAFRWVGLSLAERQIAHEDTLIMTTVETWSGSQLGRSALKQLQTDFARPTPLNLVFNKW